VESCGCQRRESVMFDPASTFLKDVAMVMARIVGLPVVGSQSPTVREGQVSGGREIEFNR
jgi:hypothetical protein